MIDLRCGDCMQLIPTIADASIDLIITSPPYNVDLGNNCYHKMPYDLYNDNVKHADFIAWLKSIFAACYPKLVPGGRVCINIGDGKNGAIPTSSDVIQFMADLRYLPMTHIIWNKKQTSSRTAWGSWKSPSSPSFPTPFEHILVFAKESRQLKTKGITDLTRDEFVKWTNPIWEFMPEMKQKKFGHPAMFPEELPRRLIKMFSWVGSTVLDPFVGAGTTAAVCKKNGRNCIGFDTSQTYIDLSTDRINKISSLGV